MNNHEDCKRRCPDGVYRVPEGQQALPPVCFTAGPVIAGPLAALLFPILTSIRGSFALSIGTTSPDTTMLMIRGDPS